MTKGDSKPPLQPPSALLFKSHFIYCLTPGVQTSFLPVMLCTKLHLHGRITIVFLLKQDCCILYKKYHDMKGQDQQWTLQTDRQTAFEHWKHTQNVIILL